ncbi:MAG: flavodoxin-dependent (E)-4-hydroxy-3-methylbut-2-enyl-diphosphate synthase [Candidatus Gastranaerophilales bacterium]|nr:flavodoxin-dependent (E)-4-hydroxy-3-methylbut-2-enyl-diphosphate synthase [Candidatus Gastranaerophilales bacterium]
MDKIQIKIGDVKIGARAPISVQSMTNTQTDDIKKTVLQIKELQNAGCEIVRLAVLNMNCAKALLEIKKQVEIPIVADIHFDYRLALEAIKQGADALRLNPGNIGGTEHVKLVVNAAKKEKIPIRIGINSGSLEKYLYADNSMNMPDKMVKSALDHIKILEDMDFNLIKVSLKSSNVMNMIEAYRKIYNIIPYPLHLGVTEAGTMRMGIIKSSVGIGSLLSEGIGDTIRVSLTENPVEEVHAAVDILRALDLRKTGVNFISCPTCGRCKINLIELAHKVENRFKNLNKPITIATMGCPVNGPNEAKDADYGIAGAIGEGYIFKKGEFILKASEDKLLDEFEKIILSDLK